MKPRFTLLLIFLLPLVQPLWGQNLFRTLGQADSTRAYLLYVPDSYDAQESVPLIIDLHRYDGEDGFQRNLSRLREQASELGFLVAYPQGATVDGSMLDTAVDELPDQGFGWNVGGQLSSNDDVGFISSLIDHVATDFEIDLSRVYVSGLGMGGQMAYYLACELSGRIAAVASVGGPLPDGGLAFSCEPGRPIPVLHLHGTEDPVAPYNGNAAALGAEGTVNFWLDINGCSDDFSAETFEDLNTNDGSTASLKTYADCEEEATVRFYTIDGGGHTWPGGNGGGILQPGYLGDINRDINAAAEIWEFFQEHTHPSPEPANELEGYGYEKWTMEYVQQDDGARRAIVFIPKAYTNDPATPWPLVLNLHGQGSNGSEQLAVTGMNAVADTAHFLVAYPYGSPDPSGEEGAFAWAVGPGDISFLEGLIDKCIEDYTVSPNHIYSTGLSGGGIMSYIFACESPGRLAAIASVTGTPPLELAAGTWDCQPEPAIPLLHMHGTEDEIVPFDGGTGILGIEFPPIWDVITNWLANNSCASSATITDLEDIAPSDNTTIILRQYTDCDTYLGADGMERPIEVWFYIIENGGHVWPGVPFPPNPFGNSNLDINASAEIWKFFNRHNLETNTATGDLNASDLGLRAYPNPAAGFITFEFELPEAARATLTLYTPIGQALQVLTNETLPGGRQQFRWRRPMGMPAGLYYYQLLIDQQRIGGTVVLGQ